MSDIERRQLGRTGLSVTVLGFGAMDLGGSPAANEISDDEAGRVLNAVLDSGTDYIDIVQFHQNLTRSMWEAEGALEELLKLKKEGKLRFIGVSGILPNRAG